MTLVESDRQYYRKISKVFHHDGGIADEDEEFGSTNVIEQILKDGLAAVCCDKDGSIALERLIQSKRVHLEQINILTQGWRQNDLHDSI